MSVSARWVVPTAALLGLSLSCTVGCVSVAPRAMSSNSVHVGGVVDATPAAVLDAARTILRRRAYVADETLMGARTELVTGRAKLVIEPADDEGTRLEIFLDERVGTDHQRRAQEMYDEIVEECRAG